MRKNVLSTTPTPSETETFRFRDHTRTGKRAWRSDYAYCCRDNIVWDAAIEHFTETEIDKIMGQLVERLGFNGILSGYTLTEAADGKKSNALHDYEFKDKGDMRRFFTPHFKHVKVWETIYPTRHNLYFAASQSEIAPFG
jgi:hypothetical protein